MKYKLTQQKGFTAIEYVAIVAAIAIATIAVVATSAGFFGSSNKNAAVIEISKVVNAAKLYRITNNSYAGVGVAALVAGGFDVDPFTTGVGENVYGNDLTVAPSAGAAGNADATLTYVTDEAGSCTALLSRYANNADGIQNAACGGGAGETLTFDID